MSNPLETEKPLPPREKLLALMPPKQRTQAADLLAKNDAGALRLLTNILSREHTARRSRAAALAVPGSMMTAAAFMSLVSETLPWYMGVAGVGGLILLTLSLLTSIPTPLEKAALEAVTESGEKGSIGLLMEGMQALHLFPALRENVKAALARHLQNLTAEDAVLLPPTYRSQLYASLNYIHRDSDLELRLAILKALTEIGDRHGLGAIYILAAGEAATKTAQTVRLAARQCLEQMQTRIDFGPLGKLPLAVEDLIHQMEGEGIDHQISAVNMLALRQMLPRLTPAHYRAALSERHRDRLYHLLALPLIYDQHRHGNTELQSEILAVAHRMGDTRALASVRKIAFAEAPTQIARDLRTTARETLRLLETLVEKEKESKTLLRGSSAPEAASNELLRATAPAASETDPSELLRAAIPHQTARIATTEKTEEVAHLRSSTGSEG